MTDNPQKSTQGSSKDGLALIIGGLFILALVFVAYNYFNKPTTEEELGTGGQETVEENGEGLLDRIRKTLEGGDKGDLNGNGAMDDKSAMVQDEKSEVYGEDDERVTNTSEEYMWVANDYNQGDITGNQYTVKSGDTLWEIAEAVYGNGSDWVKILNSNSSSVGYLPSGQQALITPGQVLVLP